MLVCRRWDEKKMLGFYRLRWDPFFMHRPRMEAAARTACGPRGEQGRKTFPNLIAPDRHRNLTDENSGYICADTQAKANRDAR